MDNCSQHKKSVAGIEDMKVLAEMIGDLHYESLVALLGRLSIKLYKDGLKDRGGERDQLGYALCDASNNVAAAAVDINKAWQISKPFMNRTP